jgi:CRISPR-associated protein Csa1
VKLDGRFLGLSEHLAADAISFPDVAVLDLKFGPRETFHRLTTTGYALVLESLFDRPVDVGCVVYSRFMNGRIIVERDFHLIGDELRQMFVEERDEKARLVTEELDPGLPAVCARICGRVGRPIRAVWSRSGARSPQTSSRQRSRRRWQRLDDDTLQV